MTTEEDFQRQLDDAPDDHSTRLVFADWLEERGDPRAEGYRALGLFRLAPKTRHLNSRGPGGWWYIESQSDAGGAACPDDWRGVRGYPHWYAYEYLTRTRRQAEDAAAIAFAQLPAARRAELLAASSGG